MGRTIQCLMTRRRTTTPRSTALYGVSSLTGTSDALATSNRGPNPFQAKKQGFCDYQRDFSLVHTHEDTGVGRKPAAPVERQGSALSARKPSIGEATSMRRRACSSLSGRPSRRAAVPSRQPSDPTKTARSPVAVRSPGVSRERSPPAPRSWRSWPLPPRQSDDRNRSGAGCHGRAESKPRPSTNVCARAPAVRRCRAR